MRCSAGSTGSLRENEAAAGHGTAGRSDGHCNCQQYCCNRNGESDCKRDTRILRDTEENSFVTGYFFLYLPGVIPYGAQMLVAISAAHEPDTRDFRLPDHATAVLSDVSASVFFDRYLRSRENRSNIRYNRQSIGKWAAQKVALAK